MKMEDNYETEIIYDVFMTHIQLLKKYFTLIQVNLLNFFILAPGETLQSKLLKPAPFMLIMLMLIIISIAIQSSKILRKYLANLHNALTPGIAIGSKIGSFSDVSVLNSLGKGVINGQRGSQEFTEGLVGVYSMQGRRCTMEDRFSVMQDVQVGLNKKMSFIGVFDGHGGEWVAEYLRTNFFQSTIEKIQRLRTTVKENTDNKQETKKTELKELQENKETKSKDKDEASKKETGPSIVVVSSKTSSLEVDENFDIPKADSENLAEEVSLKKDDVYNTVNIRRKSLASLTKKEVKVEEPSAEDYMDVNQNINYTKLLTDQMLTIDGQIVERCVTDRNLSGSTAVVALIDGELLIVANVGDSRAVMADSKGRAVPLSFDHKPNQLKEKRRIRDAGGFVTFAGVWRVAGILATSRALGDFPLKRPRPLVTAEPDVLTFNLLDHKADFVILASDGLWDVLSNEDAVSFVSSRLHEKDFGAKSLSLYAHDLGSQDNITVAVINCRGMSKGR